jgi:Flp pilus assembly protein TadD
MSVAISRAAVRLVAVTVLTCGVAAAAAAGPVAKSGVLDTRPQVEAKMRSASSHYRAGRLREAIEDLTTAAALDPRHARVRFMRGNAYFRAGDLASAARDYRMTLALSPDQPDAQLNLGFVTLRLGDTTAALEAWRAAVEQSRRDPLARAALARGEHAAGNIDAALFHFSVAVYLEADTERRDYYERDFRWQPTDVAVMESLARLLEPPPADSSLSP